jgi:enterobactin synthetase component D
VFIQSHFVHSIATIATNATTVQGVRFSKAHYHDALFKQHNIVMPASIKGALPKRKAEFLAGRLVAQAACSSYLSSTVISPIDIGLLRAPKWPKGVNGSITHCYLSSGEGVALAVSCSDRTLIGIDAEVIFSPAQAVDIAEQFTDAMERAVITSSQHRSVYHRALTAVFSAKESFFKAAAPAVGFYFDFDAVKLIEITSHQLIFKITNTLSHQFQAGDCFSVDVFEVDPDYIVTNTYFHAMST